jgi:ATP-dependent RNA helicase RhlE
VRRLANADIDSVAIHGNKSQSQRERALEAFKGGRVPVLVATDIAARGIHIDGLTHVINFDLPEVPEQYVHRIGRTARAGATGVAISFVSKDERDYLRAIEKLVGHKLAPRPAGESEADDRGSRKPQQQSRRQGLGQGGGQRRAQGHGDRRPQRDGERKAHGNGERAAAGGERSSGTGGHFQRTSGGSKPGGQARRGGPGQGGGNRSRRPERAGV